MKIENYQMKDRVLINMKVISSLSQTIAIDDDMMRMIAMKYDKYSFFHVIFQC